MIMLFLEILVMVLTSTAAMENWSMRESSLYKDDRKNLM